MFGGEGGGGSAFLALEFDSPDAADRELWLDRRARSQSTARLTLNSKGTIEKPLAQPPQTLFHPCPPRTHNSNSSSRGHQTRCDSLLLSGLLVSPTQQVSATPHATVRSTVRRSSGPKEKHKEQKKKPPRNRSRSAQNPAKALRSCG